MTRSAKLWAAGSYLVLCALIAGEVSCIAFNVMYIEPKVQRFVSRGVIDMEKVAKGELSWIPGFLKGLGVLGEYSVYLFLGAAALIGLFEWRVRGDNKPFIRLLILSTVASGLAVVTAMMLFAMTISFVLGLPPWAFR